MTKQYLKSLVGSGASSGGGSSVDIKGFTITGNINMGGDEVIGLDSPHSGSSAVNKKYVDDNFLSSSGDVDMSGHEVKGLGVPTTDTSATNKKYVDDKISSASSVSGHFVSQADKKYLSKASAVNIYETKMEVDRVFLKKDLPNEGGRHNDVRFCRCVVDEGRV